MVKRRHETLKSAGRVPASTVNVDQLHTPQEPKLDKIYHGIEFNDKALTTSEINTLIRLQSKKTQMTTSSTLTRLVIRLSNVRARTTSQRLAD